MNRAKDAGARAAGLLLLWTVLVGAPSNASASTDGGGADVTGDTASELARDAMEAAPAAPAPQEQSPPLVPPLPPIAPTPELSPVIEGAQPPATRAEIPMGARERPRALIKVIVGLAVLLILAYLAGHPAVQRLEARLGITQVITAGFPFVLLGVVARRPEVGVLTDDVLAELSPVLRLGLGWIGFMVGFRFDARSLDRLPGRAVTTVGLVTTLPFSAVVAASVVLLLVTTGLPGDLTDPVFLRDAIILGTAAATTDQAALRRIPGASGGGDGVRMLGRILRLEEVAGVLGLAAVAAYFRPPATSWHIPGTAWLLLTVGLGVALGILMYVLLRRATSGSALLVVTLGMIVFSAGFAGNIRLSPVVVCFVMGLLVANAPGLFKVAVGEILRTLERPLYFLFLLIVGALWNLEDGRGWALMVVFVLLRFGGKAAAVWLGLRGGDLGLSPDEHRALAIAPLGPLALAIVINAQLLYPGGSISLIVTAILGAAVVSEVLVQFAFRRRP